MNCRVDDGSALLLVTGATAVLAVLASLMLPTAMASYGAISYRADLVQGRALADAVVLQVIAALAAGDLPWPTPATPLHVRNGVLAASGLAVPVAVFPIPPASEWPPVVTSAAAPASTVLGLGASARLSRVVGPRGYPRTVGEPAEQLVDVEVIAWFRRARVEHRARLRVAVGAAERVD